MSDININEKVAAAIAAATSSEDVRRILHGQAIAQGLAQEVQVMPDASGQTLGGQIALAPPPARQKNSIPSSDFESGVDAMIARRMLEVTGHRY